MGAMPKPTQESALADIARARAKRLDLADRLAEQDRYFGHLVRTARDTGVTWRQIATAADISGPAAIQAARRPE